MTSEALNHIVRICKLVGGMPLAILLAAAWVEMLSPAEIASEIEQGLDLLETDLRDVPERQRSVRAIFDQSWSLFSEWETIVFQALSVFRGGFTRQAAAQVADATLWELKALVNKSLLNRTPGGRYEMHELLRQFASDKLKESQPDYEYARDRHSDYYVAFIGQREADLKGSQPGAPLAQIETEIENARSAWNWAAEQSRVERLEQAMEGLFFFYLCRMRYQEGEALCALAAKRLELVKTKDGLLLLSRVLIWQGVFSWRLGSIETADQLLQRSLEL